jgi:hypothetical protein
MTLYSPQVKYIEGLKKNRKILSMRRTRTRKPQIEQENKRKPAKNLYSRRNLQTSDFVWKDP